MTNDNWFNKLNIECIDEQDGSLTIHIEWDETDPNLKFWIDWSEKTKKDFILTTILDACHQALNNDT